MGILPQRRVYGGVRVLVLDLLSLVQDTPGWLHAAVLLLRIHVSIFHHITPFSCFGGSQDGERSVPRDREGDGESRTDRCKGVFIEQMPVDERVPRRLKI